MELLPSYLVSRRLVIRIWLPDDAERLAAAVNESLPRLEPFMPWASQEPLEIGARRELVASWNERWRRGDESYLGMFADGTIVGSIGAHRRGSDPGRVEIGYWVRSGFTGRGFATEATQLVTTACFRVPDVDMVAIHHDLANNASRRIPERLGFRRVRVIPSDVSAPGQTGSEVHWEVSRDEWAGIS